MKYAAIGSIVLLALAVLILAIQVSRLDSGTELSQENASSKVDSSGNQSDPLSNGSSGPSSQGSASAEGGATPGDTNASLPGGEWREVQIVDTIEVSDLSSDTTKEVALSPDGSTAYVALEEAGALSVVDLAARAVRQLVFVGDEPQGVAVSPDGTKVYVAVYSTSEVVTIDSATLEEIGRIKVGDEWEAFNVAVSPDGATLYVSRGFEPGIVKIDAATGQNLGLIGTSDMGDSSGVAVTPDGTKLYVSDRQWVYIFDLASSTLDRRFRLTEVERMKFTSDGKYLLVSSFSSDRPGIRVLDASTDIEVGVVLPDEEFVRGFAITDGFRRVYASSRGLVIAGR